MKNILLAVLVVLSCTLSLYAQNNLSLTIDYSNSHALQPHVYGANNWISTRAYHYNDEGFIENYNALGKPVIRYPGGTPSNYLDLNTGFHKAWPGASQRDLDRVTSFNNGMSNNGKGEKGEELSRFLDFKTQTNATTTFTLNTTSMSIDEVNLALDKIVASGEELEYVEIGNEQYFNQYESIIPDVYTYIDKAKRRANSVRSRFPNAKIGVQVPSQIYTSESFLPDPIATNQNRTETWYNAIKEETFYDAIIIHLYSSVGMDHLVTSNDFIPFKEAYKHCISHADKLLAEVLSTLEADFPHAEIWATEFHVGGFSGDVRQYRLRYSYLGGLYASNFMFKLFSDSAVSLGNWHSMVQWQQGSGTSFGTYVNYQFFNLFQEPVKMSNRFVSVEVANTMNYSGVGTHTGEFKDVEGGLFFNDDTDKGYLMIFNKWENSYTIGINELETKLSGTIIESSQLSTAKNLTLEDGLESENAFSNETILPVGGNYTLEPFSITIFEFSKETLVGLNKLKEDVDTIYPNPSSRHLTINSDAYYSSWCLYSKNGKIIAKGLLRNDGETTIDLGENKGLMLLVLESTDGNLSKTFKVINKE